MLPGWVTVLVAGTGLVITLIVTLIARARSDRRSRREERWRQETAKRERLRVQFERSLSSALRLAGLVSPTSPMWKAELTVEEIALIQPVLTKRWPMPPSPTSG
jgi:prephenate dehydrogenase